MVRCGLHALLLSALATSGVACASSPEEKPAAARPPEAPFVRAPLDSMSLTGNFGEYRSGHFHGGVDLSTSSVVGSPVYAPLAGHIERVRVSGAGYGRSLYLKVPDGRLFVYGHLDAFDEPVASYVSAIQDSSGQYEQDLWPVASRLPVAAGQRLAWSGESGAGPPHLHFEIRRGDMAFNPLRRGVTIPDVVAPAILAVTLEPLDDSSHVGGRRTPWRAHFQSAHDTAAALALGRLRVIVAAMDARDDGAYRMAPASVAFSSAGTAVACRFDSVSWDGEMPEVELVYDRGRAAPRPRQSIRLWAPPGFRPRVIASDAPLEGAAGVIEIARGDPPRLVRIDVDDVAGNLVTRWIKLSAGGSAPPLVAKVPRTTDPPTLGGGGTRGDASFAWEAPENAFYEPTPLAHETLGHAAGGAELALIGSVHGLTPKLAALRKPLTVRMELPAGAGAARVALCRDDGGGWEFLAAAEDTNARSIAGGTRRLGRFALFRDRLAPRIRKPRVLPFDPSAPYSRWGLEARLLELGVGVDSRESHFLVDGRRVPSEWDVEKGRLRWRPRERPSPGSHRVEIVAVDRVGNRARLVSGFVIN